MKGFTTAHVMFVSKPLVPPWDDSGKVLPYLVAKGCRDLRFVVPVVRGMTSGLRNCEDAGVYKSLSSFSVPLLEKARLFAWLLRAPLPPILHFFFTPTRQNAEAVKVMRALRGPRRLVQTVMSLPKDLRDLAASLFGDVVIVWSRAAKEEVERALRFRGLEAEVVHIRPGVEPIEPASPKEKAMIRRDLGLPVDCPLVLYAGDLEFSSGALVVAEAAPLVLEATRAVLIFASRPKTKAAHQVREHIEGSLASWEERVRFFGATQRFRDLLRCVDLQVLPAESTYAKTDIPLVVLEGLMAGVPVIVGQGTPMEELVGLGAALGVPPMDPKRLAEMVIGLVGGGEGRASALGASQRALAIRYYSCSEMALRHGEVYRRLLAEIGG